MYLPPKRLRRGMNVAIVAPASPFKTDELLAGLDIIRSMGLNPILGSNVKNVHTHDVHAGSAIQRAEELMWAFTHPDIGAVITVTGGLGCAAALPYLDFGAIRQSRRVILGISDITSLNNGLLAATGLINVNGQYPSIRLDKGRRIQEADSESLKFTIEMLMSDQNWGERPFDLNQYIPRTLSSGQARGPAIGGNLDTFCGLLGTPFMPEVDGAILFLEDVHKDGEVIDRLLMHLQLAGIFDRIAGVIIGEFVDVPLKTEPKVPAIEDVLIEYFGKGGPPAIYGASFSHGPYTIPIPIGAECEMNADTGTVSYNFTMAE